MQTKLTNILQTQFNKTIEDCTNEELYTGLLMLVKNLSNDRKPTSTPRKLYYISAEFLIFLRGSFLSYPQSLPEFSPCLSFIVSHFSSGRMSFV